MIDSNHGWPGGEWMRDKGSAIMDAQEWMSDQYQPGRDQRQPRNNGGRKELQDQLWPI